MAETTPTPQAGEQQQQMQPQLVFHTQYVKDLSFENPKAPQSLMAGGEQPAMDINIGVAANKLEEDRQFEIVLTITATATRKEKEEKVFIAELAYAAVLSIGKEVEEQHIHPLVMIEGPRMLFPFARQFMAQITQAGGFMPLNLQPIDFLRVYQAGLAQQQAQQAKAGGGDDTISIPDNLATGNGSDKAAAKPAKKAKKK